MDFDAITLDTSIFETNGLDLDGGVLNALKTFAKNKIAVVLVDIIEKEVLCHLTKKAEEARNSAYGKLDELKKYNLLSSLEAGNLINFLKQNDIQNIVKSRWDIYKKIHKIEIIASDTISVSELMKDYFDKKPPFSEKKKAEFPDAIALQALRNWANANNKRVLCFSTDSDWKNYIENSENLKYSGDIKSILGELNKNLSLSNQIKMKIDGALLAVQCSEIGVEADDAHLWESFFEKLERVLDHKNVSFGGNIELKNKISDYNICLLSFDFLNEGYEILAYDEKEEVIDILIPMTLDYCARIEWWSEENNADTFSDIDCSCNTKAIIQMDLKTKEIIQNIEITNNSLPVNLSVIKSFF